MFLKHFAHGVATFIPGLSMLRSKGTGGVVSARYCYSVWLRHMVMARTSKLDTNPTLVAELGPGDTLGVGLAALISGAEKYYAFDVVKHADISRNLLLFDELIELFRASADIPGEKEFPDVKPYLQDYRFPVDIFTADRMKNAMEPERLERIRRSLQFPDGTDLMLTYKVPWHNTQVIEQGAVDLVFSQAVLEHVNFLDDVYRAMNLWLRPGGYVSHQIDFKCHSTADAWNGHWTYSDLVWKLVRGRRPYFLNREPCSAHLSALARHGFRIVCDRRVKLPSTVAREDLAMRFKELSNEDLTTGGIFVQAVKV